MTLDELLIKLTEADEAIEGPDLELTQLVMDKIDGIKYILDKIDLEASYAKAQLERWQNRKKRLEANEEKFKAWIVRSLQDKGLDQLPGNKYLLKLTPNNPKVVIDREPTYEDWAQMPEAVSTKITCTWNKSYIKDHLDQLKTIGAQAQLVRDLRPTFKEKKS